MSKSEYVRLSPPEKFYGEKQLLSSQLELLELIQHFHRYRALRNEELVLKVTLKNIVEETARAIEKLERLLPRAHYQAPALEETAKEKKQRERKLSLQEEIEKVRQKLANLRVEM